MDHNVLLRIGLELKFENAGPFELTHPMVIRDRDFGYAHIERIAGFSLVFDVLATELIRPVGAIEDGHHDVPLELFFAGQATRPFARFELPHQFGLFFLGEYTNMFLMAAIAVSLFLGGYHAPLPFLNPENTFGVLAELYYMVIFLLKVYGIIFVMIWMRWTFPRVRFDQLLNFCWKILIPVSMANLAITAIVMKL